MEKTNLVPPKEWNRTPGHSRHIVTRKYRWYDILEFGSEDDYVKLLVEELDKQFKIENKVEEIVKDSGKYQKYRLEFCNSIVNAIEHGNKIVAHANDGTAVNFDVVVFGNVIDRYMRYFYNALVGLPS